MAGQQAELGLPIPRSNRGGCGICRSPSCDCIRTAFSSAQPRIQDYSGNRRGLRATSAMPGDVVYREGDLIGRISGRIAPPGTFQDKWTYNLEREDIRGGPICQIHCGEVGSIFRHLQESDQPVTKCEPRLISGQWVLVVEAVQRIDDGMILTKPEQSLYAAE